MKILRKILIVFIICLAILFILAYGIFQLKGEDIVAAKLKESFSREVSIKDVSLSFPLIVKIKELNIENFASVDYLSASASALGLLTGRIILNNVTLQNPHLSIERFRDGSFNFPVKKNKPKSKPKGKASSELKKNAPLILLSIDITDGELVFKDRKSGIDNFAINIKDLNLHISKASFMPSDLKIKFDVSGNMYAFNLEKTGVFNTRGWVDLKQKNMDGTLDVEGGDCIIIVPYLTFISSERFKEGRFNIHSTLKAKNNNLTISTELELEDLAKAVLADESKEKGIMDIVEGKVFDFLRDEQDKVTVEFTYRTKLDNPLGGSLDTRSLMENVIQDKILKPLTEENGLEKIKKIGGSFKDIGEIFKEKFKK